MKPLALDEIALAVGCTACYNGIRIACVTTDSRSVPKDSLFVAITGDRFNGHDYVASALRQGALAAVVSEDSPGVAENARLLRVADTRDALIAIGGLYRSKFSFHCVGVTGSVGKTTTKDMVAAVLSAKYQTLKTPGNFNNEIGMPKTLFQLDNTVEAAVIEMGMQGPGEIAKLAKAARPDIGVITNIGVSHLEQLGTRENILKAKLELAHALPDGASLFLCGDNDLLRTVDIPRLNVRFFGVENPDCAYFGEEIQEKGPISTFFLRHNDVKIHVTIPCMGKHHILDALAACAVGDAFGISLPDCAKALETYTPSGMRQRVVYWKDTVVVEDCYNASPDSMRAALDTLASYPGATRRIAVLGDMLELGKISEQSHWEIGSYARQKDVDCLLAYGPMARFYGEGFGTTGETCGYFLDFDSLLTYLRRQICPGCVIWVKGSHGMHLERLLERLYQLEL